MALTVVGKENVDYTNKNQVQIKGTIIHCTEALDLKRGQGQKCSSEFVKNDIADKIMIGDNVRILYNKYGKVEDVEVLSF